MKRIIAKLRIAGLISLALFLISCIVQPPSLWRLQFSWVQSTLILTSFIIYAIIIGLWLYHAYIATYLREEDNEE